jgi:hypothetical protein
VLPAPPFSTPLKQSLHCWMHGHSGWVHMGQAIK